MKHDEVYFPDKTGRTIEKPRTEPFGVRTYIFGLSIVYDVINKFPDKFSASSKNDLLILRFEIRTLRVFMCADEFNEFAKDFRAVLADQHAILTKIAELGGAEILDTNPDLQSDYINTNERVVEMVQRVHTLYREQVTFKNIF